MCYFRFESEGGSIILLITNPIPKGSLAKVRALQVDQDGFVRGLYEATVDENVL